MLRFRHRMRPRKIQISVDAGQGGRMKRLRQIVTGLIRYERVEPTYAQADEARQYAERLIYLAIKNGDKHQETMDTADYWLLEKDLIHKLFKVLVPRYQKYTTCFTDLHKQAVEYPGSGFPKGVLELRGNPWPPIVQRRRETRYILSNILLAGARKDYHISKQKALEEKLLQQQQEESVQSTTSPSSSLSSSVDSGEIEMDEVETGNSGSSVDAASPPTSTSTMNRTEKEYSDR